MKSCSVCKVEKGPDEFHKRSRALDGRNYQCKTCLSSIHREYRFTYRYNLPPGGYARLLAAQGGVCAICGVPPKKNRLAIDHDHECCPGTAQSCGRCIRGLLCTGCNTALRAVESAEWRSLAENYLARHVDREVE